MKFISHLKLCLLYQILKSIKYSLDSLVPNKFNFFEEEKFPNKKK